MTLKPPGRHMEASARVKAIADNASSVVVNPDTHPKFYLRSGRELIRMAASYQEDGQTEHAYILYMRFLTIFVDKIRQHPNYKEVPPSERKVMQNFCNKILPTAEVLKKELLKRFEKEHAEYLIQVEERNKLIEEQRKKELEEQKRLEKERNDRKSSGLPATSTNYDKYPSSNFHNATGNNGTFLPSGVGLTASTSQPNVPVPGPFFTNEQLEEFRRDFDDGGYSDPSPSAPPSSTAGASSIPTPAFDRSTKPTRFLNPNESGIRSLIIPSDITATFLKRAVSNTSKNVETCGLLTGKISGGALLITDLIIPKQTGTSDTCNMLDEATIFTIQDKFNLITFGWIHTHPSQTAFLSSIDMHTHYSYQVMMPEAVAIVCAPKHNQTGIFTLTPEGMEELGSCSLQGFHPHKPSGLFAEASHYSLDPNRRVEVHDLR